MHARNLAQLFSLIHFLWPRVSSKYLSSTNEHLIVWQIYKSATRHTKNPQTFVPVSSGGMKGYDHEGFCQTECSRWFPAGLSLRSTRWGVLRRPGLSSGPPSLTPRQTWGRSRDTSSSSPHWFNTTHPQIDASSIPMEFQASSSFEQYGARIKDLRITKVRQIISDK